MIRIQTLQYIFKKKTLKAFKKFLANGLKQYLKNSRLRTTKINLTNAPEGHKNYLRHRHI